MKRTLTGRWRSVCAFEEHAFVRARGLSQRVCRVAKRTLADAPKDAAKAGVCGDSAEIEHGDARRGLLHPQVAELRGGAQAHRWPLG